MPFRETIVPPPTVDMVNESIQEQNPVGKNEKQREFDDDEDVLEPGLVRVFTPNKYCMVQIRAVPLPLEVTNYLDENSFLIKTLDQYISAKISKRNKSDIHIESILKQSTKEAIKEFKDHLEKLFLEAGKQWKGCVDDIWAFGPKRVGPNLLLNKVEGYNRTSMWNCLRNDKADVNVVVREYDYSVVSGFQLATLTGPLCDEPMRGVCFIVEKWEIGSHVAGINYSEENICEKNVVTENGDEHVHIQLSKLDIENEKFVDNDSLVNQISASPEISKKDSEQEEVSNDKEKRSEVKGHVSGQLISIMKEACQKSFQTQPQRIMAAMYKCNIQATADVLGMCSYYFPSCV